VSIFGCTDEETSRRAPLSGYDCLWLQKALAGILLTRGYFSLLLVFRTFDYSGDFLTENNNIL
jgi:hypothetical protein